MINHNVDKTILPAPTAKLDYDISDVLNDNANTAVINKLEHFMTPMDIHT